MRADLREDDVVARVRPVGAGKLNPELLGHPQEVRVHAQCPLVLLDVALMVKLPTDVALASGCEG